MRVWIVTKDGHKHVILSTVGGGDRREQAKQKAWTWLGGDPNLYTVTPITHEDDAVKLDITVSL